jgi:hypothetical protein
VQYVFTDCKHFCSWCNKKTVKHDVVSKAKCVSFNMISTGVWGPDMLLNASDDGDYCIYGVCGACSILNRTHAN